MTMLIPLCSCGFVDVFHLPSWHTASMDHAPLPDLNNLDREALLELIRA
jgi:hypothetical protein